MLDTITIEINSPYLFFGLFIKKVNIRSYDLLITLINIAVLTAMHYFMCDIRYLSIENNIN